MKKSLMVVVLLLVLSGGLYSQISIGKGVKGGLNIATAGGADAEKFGAISAVTQFNAGVFVNIGLPGPLSIQPEVLYSVKGAKVAGTFSGTPFTTTATVTYVDIPVLLKFNIPLVPGSPVKPNIFAGPGVGILLTAKSKTEVPGSPTTESDDKSTTESMDFGAIVGVGVDVNLVAVTLMVDARYYFGLKTTDKSPAPGPFDVKNRVISVNVGLGL